jgi:hypothetical protein
LKRDGKGIASGLGRPDHDAWTCGRSAGLPYFNVAIADAKMAVAATAKHVVPEGEAHFPRQATIRAGNCCTLSQDWRCEAGMRAWPIYNLLFHEFR